MKLAISKGGPECPGCGERCFDDWWRAPGMKHGSGIVQIRGSLRCHSCGKFFAVTNYNDGETHSVMNDSSRVIKLSDRQLVNANTKSGL